MVKIKRTLKKIKHNYKRFKKDERGGDMINQLLMLAVSLLLIALLIFLAMEYFNKAKSEGESLFDFGEDEKDTTENNNYVLDYFILGLPQLVCPSQKLEGKANFLFFTDFDGNAKKSNKNHKYPQPNN